MKLRAGGDPSSEKLAVGTDEGLCSSHGNKSASAQWEIPALLPQLEAPVGVREGELMPNQGWGSVLTWNQPSKDHSGTACDSECL